MKRCVIVGGAPIGDYERIKSYLTPDDYVIYCDSGLKHLDFLGTKPNLIVGDFDSWEEETEHTEYLESVAAENHYTRKYVVSDASSRENARLLKETQGIVLQHFDTINDRTAADRYPDHLGEVLVLPPEKYDTDTVFGVKEGIRLGFQDFLLLGVIGRRLDHSFANLAMLLQLAAKGLTGRILDDYSEMELITPERDGWVKDSFSTFSLINLSGIARKITIQNAKYCYLPDEEITPFYQYGISNEVIPGKTARIHVGEGNLLLIKNYRS